MARGFIRNPLDVRLLILYILDHLISPVTMAELTDLALCDEGVDYFQFATALGALTENGHVAESEDGLLSITEKGHANCAICANELPISVRTKCDRSTQLLNKELKRRNQNPRRHHPGAQPRAVHGGDDHRRRCREPADPADGSTRPAAGGRVRPAVPEASGSAVSRSAVRTAGRV